MAINLSNHELHTIILPKVRFDLKYSDYNLCKVKCDSPVTKKKAVELLANFFKRELGFEFSGYIAEQHLKNDCVAYLILQDNYTAFPTAIGCVCFYKYEDNWELSWVWIHPYERRNKLLTNIWAFLKEELGDFNCQEPFSESFKSFLLKQELIQIVK